MKTKSLFLNVLLGTGISFCQAAEKPENSVDVQVRVPVNIQYLNLNTNRYLNFGASLRLVFPDVTAKENETARFYAAGPLMAYGKKGSTIELLGGERYNEDGYQDPLINLRVIDRSFSKLHIGADMQYFPGKERRRFYSMITLETPLQIGTYQMRYGLESETIFSFSGKEDLIGVGPRIVFPLPLRNLSENLSSSLAIGYQFQNNQDFLRFYAGITYRFGKK